MSLCAEKVASHSLPTPGRRRYRAESCEADPRAYVARILMDRCQRSLTLNLTVYPATYISIVSCLDNMYSLICN